MHDPVDLLTHDALLRTAEPRPDADAKLRGDPGYLTDRLRPGLRVVDRPVLCHDVVRCVGDPVAAVAAETPELAQRALALIDVRYEALPLVDDAEAALAPGAAPLHPGGNLLHQGRHARGDAAAAAAACVHWVEAEYFSPMQMHAFLETEGGVVEPD